MKQAEFVPRQEQAMGFAVTVQRVDRTKSSSYYTVFPAQVADAMEMHKGDRLTWSVIPGNALSLTRGEDSKGHPVSLQLISRANPHSVSRTFLLNFPLVIVETLRIEKGQVWEWHIMNADSLRLERKN